MWKQIKSDRKYGIHVSESGGTFTPNNHRQTLMRVPWKRKRPSEGYDER